MLGAIEIGILLRALLWRFFSCIRSSIIAKTVFQHEDVLVIVFAVPEIKIVKMDYFPEKRRMQCLKKCPRHLRFIEGERT